MLWASVTSIFFQLQAWILHEECYKTRRIKNTCSKKVVMYSMWNTVTRPLTHCTYVLNPLADLTLVYCAIFDTQWIRHTCNDTPKCVTFWNTLIWHLCHVVSFLGKVFDKKMCHFWHTCIPHTHQKCVSTFDTPSIWHLCHVVLFFETNVWHKNVSFLTYLYYFPVHTKIVCHFWHTFNLTSVSCLVTFLRQVFDTKMCA